MTKHNNSADAPDSQKLYIGSELEYFANAINWKNYFRRMVVKHINGRVLEVGAGIGTTTAVLAAGATYTEWTCLEPDSKNCQALISSKQLQSLPRITTRQGILQDLRAHETFDTILYMDVLEHIEDDREELLLAAKALRPKGKIIILSPAHQQLFSDFDASIGHFRRYSSRSLKSVVPASCQIILTRYLDSTGLLLSLGNKWLGRNGKPSRVKIAIWDRFFVPLSTLLDRLLHFSVGKSILVVMTRLS